MAKTATSAPKRSSRARRTTSDEPTPGADVVVLYGYLEHGAVLGTVRLSEVPRGDDYIQIPLVDIVDRFAADGDGHRAGRVAIWVRRRAKVITCQKVEASSFDDDANSSRPPGPRRWPRG